jgi:hypothetical protein
MLDYKKRFIGAYHDQVSFNSHFFGFDSPHG